jgi:hypothetical protein
MLEASGLSTATTYALKYTTRRERPDQTDSPDQWFKSGGQLSLSACDSCFRRRYRSWRIERSRFPVQLRRPCPTASACGRGARVSHRDNLPVAAGLHCLGNDS